MVNDIWTQQWDIYPLDEITITKNYNDFKDLSWERIKNVRDQNLISGVKVTIDGADKWFHTDIYSRTQWLGMVILGANLPANVNWKTMDGSFVVLTPAIVLQVFSAIQIKELTDFTNGETLKAQIYAAADPTLVDINVGWMPIYKG